LIPNYIFGTWDLELCQVVQCYDAFYPAYFFSMPMAVAIMYQLNHDRKRPNNWGQLYKWTTLLWVNHNKNHGHHSISGWQVSNTSDRLSQSFLRKHYKYCSHNSEGRPHRKHVPGFS
jgi:hypothetical protein